MNALSEFASAGILGLPLFAWAGAVTLIMLIITAAYGYGLMKGKFKGSIRTHQALAAGTIITGLAHAILAISLFL